MAVETIEAHHRAVTRRPVGLNSAPSAAAPGGLLPPGTAPAPQTAPMPQAAPVRSAAADVREAGRVAGTRLHSAVAVGQTDRSEHWLRRLTSIPSLALSLALVTLLVAGPFQQLDVMMHRTWFKDFVPGFQPFAQDVLDRIAGQAVSLPVLAIVAIVMAVRTRCWRPLTLAALAEAGFYLGVGLLKLLLARTAPVLGDPSFFGGGFLVYGDRGMSFPSGHASEAVLVYGTAAHLIIREGISRRAALILRWLVGLITVNTVVVSFGLGWHWMGDLMAGLLAGGFFLRLLLELDRLWQERVPPEAAMADVHPSPAPLGDAFGQGSTEASGPLPVHRV